MQMSSASPELLGFGHGYGGCSLCERGMHRSSMPKVLTKEVDSHSFSTVPSLGHSADNFPRLLAWGVFCLASDPDGHSPLGWSLELRLVPSRAPVFSENPRNTEKTASYSSSSGELWGRIRVC